MLGIKPLQIKYIMFRTGYSLATFSFSNSDKGGDTPALLMSPWYNRSAEGHGRCLKFRYMFLGSGNATLKLYQRTNILPRENPIWEGTSAGDNSWQYGQVSIAGVTESQLIFEGRLPRAGLITIAGLYFTSGYCSVEPSKASKGVETFSF